jgi:hypothetical protein
MYMDCHKGYRVPYVETPGNHDVTPPGKVLFGSDIDWHEISAFEYETYFGQRDWSFRMGDFYVLMHDWSSARLRDWAAKDYAAAGADPSIKFRLVGQHYDSKWDGAKTGNYAFRPPTCDLMLIGHGHRTETRQTSPYCIYEERAAFVYGTAGFFNFERKNDAWTCDQTVSPPRDEARDVWGLFAANGSPAKVRCDQPDPMNISADEVTITNDLPENFYDGRVRFVLPKGNYGPIQNGTILAEYDCPDQRKTALLVRVNIPANGVIRVRLAPSGT